MASWAVPLAISGLGALGGLISNKPKEVKTNQTTNTDSDTQTAFQNTGFQSGSSTPTYDPYSEELKRALIQKHLASLDEDPNLTGYGLSGVRDINNLAGLRTQSLQNALASRGMGQNPYAPLISESARVSDVANFRNQIPLLARQLRNTALTNAGGFFSNLKPGQEYTGFNQGYGGTSGEQHGASHTEGTNVQPGNEAGGGISSLATILAGLYGNNAFGPKKPSGSYNPAVPDYSTGY